MLIRKFGFRIYKKKEDIMMQFISDNYFYIVGILAISILLVKYLKSKKSKEIEKI